MVVIRCSLFGKREYGRVSLTMVVLRCSLFGKCEYGRVSLLLIVICEWGPLPMGSGPFFILKFFLESKEKRCILPGRIVRVRRPNVTHETNCPTVLAYHSTPLLSAALTPPLTRGGLSGEARFACFLRPEGPVVWFHEENGVLLVCVHSPSYSLPHQRQYFPEIRSPQSGFSQYKMGRLMNSAAHHHGPRVHGPRTKDHGPRTTDQGPRTTNNEQRFTYIPKSLLSLLPVSRQGSSSYFQKHWIQLLPGRRRSFPHCGRSR